MKNLGCWTRLRSEGRLELELKELVMIVLPHVGFDFRFLSEFCPRQLQVKLNLDFEDGLESEISIRAGPELKV